MPPPNNTYQQRQLLLRFIQQVGTRSDTPSLIMIIAADADYLGLCRSIVDPSTESDPEFTAALKGVYREAGLNPDLFKEQLTPAAKALGLLPSANMTTDYYRLLGVGTQADTQEIKKAFRRKAAKVHPDANANLTRSSRQFVELNDAYQTLRNPLSRRHYDANRQNLYPWRERPGLSLAADGRPTIFLWYLCGLLFIFIILLFVLDIVF